MRDAHRALKVTPTPAISLTLILTLTISLTLTLALILTHFYLTPNLHNIYFNLNRLHSLTALTLTLTLTLTLLVRYAQSKLNPGASSVIYATMQRIWGILSSGEISLSESRNLSKSLKISRNLFQSYIKA
eukprot:1238760-Amorphochlora_amoeboformis.AAC.1